MPWMTPHMFTSITHSSSSWAASAAVCETVTPALLKTIPSGAGIHSFTSAANAIWPPRSRTSSLRTSTGPSIVDGRLLQVVLVPVADRDGQPWRASRCAIARPMPDPAPVMTAVRPETIVPLAMRVSS